MITSDIVLAHYIRERFPFIEKSIDYQLYAANLSANEMLAALNAKLKGDFKDVADGDIGGDNRS